MKRKIYVISIGMIVLFGCAAKPGGKSDCPECNNTTELLVGSQCVPIEQVEVCGPDGHAHGEICHCFSGQEPAVIGGKEYCLQSCDPSPVEDVDELACEAVFATPESATAVTSWDEFETVHVDAGKYIILSVTPDTDNYFHFGAPATGDYAVYLSVGGIWQGAYLADTTRLDEENIGANEDCPAVYPAQYHVLYTAADTGTRPIIVKLHPPAGMTSVNLFLHEAGEHE